MGADGRDFPRIHHDIKIRFEQMRRMRDDDAGAAFGDGPELAENLFGRGAGKAGLRFIENKKHRIAKQHAGEQ